MSDLDYDLFVIGAGSGGVRAARMAAGFGARVAVAEDRYMGGTCVNVGCVPKKLYVYASEYGKHFEDARGFGWDSVKPAFDWSTLRDNKSTEIARLNAIYDRLLDGAGCEVIEGRARIIDPNTVAVGERHFTTRRILIATGGWPYKPDFEGRELAVTSNEIFDLPEFPRASAGRGRRLYRRGVRRHFQRPRLAGHAAVSRTAVPAWL
jgi:glutathione reductase (NADPH)